jgi:hypothetical protein
VLVACVSLHPKLLIHFALQGKSKMFDERRKMRDNPISNVSKLIFAARVS